MLNPVAMCEDARGYLDRLAARRSSPVTTGAAQQTITGAWRSETSSWWTSGWTVVFDVRGNSLTGVVTNCPRAGAVEIFDARVDAGTVHFKCRSEDGKSTIAFSGKVNGDRITFSWDLHEPEPVPAPAYDTGERPGEIIVRRVSDGAGRLILDRARRATSNDPSPVHLADIRPHPEQRTRASELAHLLG